jgi:hypothetical protein
MAAGARAGPSGGRYFKWQEPERGRDEIGRGEDGARGLGLEAKPREIEEAEGAEGGLVERRGGESSEIEDEAGVRRIDLDPEK